MEVGPYEAVVKAAVAMGHDTGHHGVHRRWAGRDPRRDRVVPER